MSISFYQFRSKVVNGVASRHFGFGGHNATLVAGRIHRASGFSDDCTRTKHETVGHGIENARGQHVSKALDNSVDKIPRSAKAAVQRENEIRKEHGIPERVNFYKKWKE
jgi:hypothetical protein